MWRKAGIVLLFAITFGVAWCTRYADIPGYGGYMLLYRDRWTGTICAMKDGKIVPLFEKSEKQTKAVDPVAPRRVYVYRVAGEEVDVPETELADFFEALEKNQKTATLISRPTND